MKETGITTPEGEFIDLQEGETFAVIRDRENDLYQVVVKDSEGNITKILEEGAMGAKNDVVPENAEDKEAAIKKAKEKLDATYERLPLNEAFTKAAEYLERLDTYAEHVSIDAAGNIKYESPS